MSPWLSDVFLSSQSDQRLVRLAQAGHQQAFAVIVERYRRELVRFAARLCPDGHGEDIVQQTFLSAFAALQSGTEVTHLRGWLYTILRRQAARAAEPAHAPAELLEMATAGPALEEAVGDRMLAIDTLSEIGQLPDRQRTALVATALEGRSRAEVAGLLGLSEGAVRQLVHRARAAVRGAVTAITPFPLLRWVVSRQSSGSDWTTAELVAGAGGASGAAVAIKIGAVMAVGLGVAGAVAVRPQAGHRHAPAAIRGPSGQAQAGAGVGQAPSALAVGPLAGQSAGANGLAASGTISGLLGAVAPGRSGAGLVVAGPEGGRPSGNDGGRGGPGQSGSSGGDDRGSGGGSGSSGGGDHGGTSGSGGGSDGGSRSDGGTVSSVSGSGSSGGSDGGSGTSGGSGSSNGGSTSSSGSDGGSTTSGSSDGGSTTSGSTSSSGGGGSSDGGLSGSDGGSTLSTVSTSGH